MTADPTELTAAAAARLIRAGRLSARQLLDACLARVDRLEPRLRAWVVVDREGAARAADAFDRRPVRGPLGGIPIGVKDIIDVAGLPTAAGFEPYRDRIAEGDAPVVAGLRGGGAIVLGKTATTQFAYRDPPPTLNPWAADLTPGGSSTGSAVAVAARMVPLAIGTQTGGSVLRPAAYGGVVGYKPSFGLVDKKGVLPVSRSTDYVGVLARSVEDAGLFLAAAGGRRTLATAQLPPRLGLLGGALDLVGAEVRERVLDAARRFRAAGAEVVSVEPETPLEVVFAAHRVVLQVDTAEVHADLYAERWDDYRPRLRASIAVGRAIPALAYARAQLLRSAITDEYDRLVGAGLDALLLPTCDLPPEPPETGDASLQAIFSLTGQPSISLPHGLSAAGLPVAIQLAGRRLGDAALLRVARWCERHLAPVGEPPL
jgi:Asp-tRNA(Asn)/Glu-tRNA(Gln) amidotransferase A subunit family amidase